MTKDKLAGVKTLLPFLAIKHIDPHPFADVITALEQAWAERDAIKAKVRELRSTLACIARYGNGSGKIPCPSDDHYYVRPMQELAKSVLEKGEKEKERHDTT